MNQKQKQKVASIESGIYEKGNTVHDSLRKSSQYFIDELAKLGIEITVRKQTSENGMRYVHIYANTHYVVLCEADTAWQQLSFILQAYHDGVVTGRKLNQQEK